MKKIVRLTENDLHSIIKDSVKTIMERWDIAGHVSSDGNSMVGGDYASRKSKESMYLTDKLLQALADDGVDPEIYDKFEDYCLDNEDAFKINAIISVSYDESTNYGSKGMPVYEIDEIGSYEKALDYVLNFEDKEFAKFAASKLKEVVENLDVSDFDLDSYEDDDYEF